MKIIYTIAGFYRSAGMERVLANKANWLCRHGWDVLIVTTEQNGRPNAFLLDDRIRMTDLAVGYENTNGASVFKKMFKHPVKCFYHKWALSKLLKKEQADVTVSMFCGDERFLTKIKDGSHKVLEVHFSRFKRLQYGRKGLWRLADRIRSSADARIVRSFERFVVLTQEDMGYWGNIPCVRCIPNARTFTMDPPASLDNHVVIAVGRYSEQKNFKDLLAVWSRIDRRDWVLHLVGDGEQRNMLEELAGSLGISDSVVFGKCMGDIRNVYEGASILALSSLYEGLPMVLIEAQSAGIPVVAYECKCGPKDVLTDGVDGYIVPEGNTDILADRLSRLMTDTALRKKMGAAAYAASERYEEETIMAQWETLFREL